MKPMLDSIPVIVGVGESSIEPRVPIGLEPIALMHSALQRAEDDAGGQRVMAESLRTTSIH